MTEQERIEQRKRAAYRRRHRERVRKKQMMTRMGLLLAIAIVAVVIVAAAIANGKHTDLLATEQDIQYANELKKINDVEPDIDVQLLDPNKYSRPQTKLEKVNGIVVHYTANPGTTAAQNRSYFNSLAETKKTSASSHFVIGLDGEIVQCVPCNEVAYASNDRNSDTISIECCIPDKSGKFNDKTYQSLIKLTTWLMGRYDLTAGDVIRHYDVTGKKCPKYFVDHPEAWDQFRQDLVDYIEKNGVEKEVENASES